VDSKRAIFHEQQTLSRSFSLSGVGLHTGVECRIRVLPANPDTGRMFVVDDVEIPARADCVVDTSRCTTLGFSNQQVRTVEHLMAALAGCLIDNARIEVEGPEIPILDGSSLPFVEMINQSGICTQGVPAHYISVDETLTIENGAGQSRMSAIPSERCELSVETSFPNWPEGNASTTMVFEPEFMEFQGAIAPARTFAFADEVNQLLSRGLAQGGSLNNVVIITPPSTFSTELRLPGEWWRHKVLDLIGDLALTDSRLGCSVTANRPGHKINTRLAAALINERRAVSQEL